MTPPRLSIDPPPNKQTNKTNPKLEPNHNETKQRNLKGVSGVRRGASSSAPSQSPRPPAL
eukprot:2723907-Rhodomonas_salina.1